MVEKELMFDNNESVRQELVRALKEKGIKDPETKSLLINWTIEQERSVESSTDPDAPIQFNVRRARLYFEAGYTEEAIENFGAALTQAHHEHRDDIRLAIIKEMEEKGL